MTGGISAPQPLIALCGTSTSGPAEDELAFAVGTLLAERGATVVCGGLGGVMTSGAAGAAGAGGTVVGLLPGSDVVDANPHVTVAIATGMGELRNGLIARSCAAMIAIGAGYGTLSEIGFMRRLGKPVACLQSWTVIKPGDDRPDPEILWAETPDAAVNWVLQHVSG